MSAKSPAPAMSTDEPDFKCTRLHKIELDQVDEPSAASHADLKQPRPMMEINDAGVRVVRRNANWPDPSDNYLVDRLSPSSFAAGAYPLADDRYFPAEQAAREAAGTPYETKYCPPPATPPQPPVAEFNYNYNYMGTPAASLTLRQMPAPAPAQTAQNPAYSGGAYSQRAGRLHGHGHAAAAAYQTPINQRPSYNPAIYPQHFPNMWYPNASYGYGGSGGGGGSASAAYSGFGPNYGGGGGGVQRAPHQHYSQHQDRYGHDPMMDMLQMSNSGREARNRAEKNRRDKLNGSIQELSTLVPHVAESPKRVDKTAVLRFAAHGLRLQHVFGQTCSQESRTMQASDALMKLLDSFFITLTCHGQIVLISRSVEQHLGHCQSDLYGQNVLHITHPEDHNMIKQLLIPTDLDSLFDSLATGMDEGPRLRTKDEEDYIDQRLREDKRSFTVRLARAGPRSEPTTYEVVKIDGIFRRSDGAPRGVRTNTFPSTLQLIRRTRRDDSMPLHTISGNDIVLVAIARIIRPPKIINSSLESNTLEYKTRHLIDGRIVDCEQRIGIVAGYMADEIRNLSPFTFIHQDDVRWVIVALRQMYDCNSSYGESTYRLLTRNGNFIYLQTKGYLEIDKATNQVHSFVCMNTLLDEAEGRRRVQDMKNKFSVIINTKIPNSRHDAPASEDPQQLERAVLCLIENLQKSPSDDEDDAYCIGSGSVGSSSQTATIEEIHCNGLADSYMNGGGGGAVGPSGSGKRLNPHSASATSTRSAKTPPLALVPPEPASVKSSISKSVSVVNVTAAKHLRDSQQRVKSPLTHNINNNNNDNETCNSPNSLSVAGDACSEAEANEMCSPMKRKRDLTDFGDNNASGERNPKRRINTAEIEDALSNSLNEIGRTLDEQRLATIKLRDKSYKYDVPNSTQRLDDLIVEHQKQSELYVNIKSEYNEMQMQNCNNNDNENTTTHQQQSIEDAAVPWDDDQHLDGDDDDSDDDVEYVN